MSIERAKYSEGTRIAERAKVNERTKIAKRATE